MKSKVLEKQCSIYRNVFLSAVLVQLDPSCTQEYKWRELEEQRQAQKLQRQLQQEQAYLLSLQQNQNLDSSKTTQQQSTKPPQDPEPVRGTRQQSPEPDATKQSQDADCEKTRFSQNNSLEKSAGAPKLPVTDLHGPESEPVREVNPCSSTSSHWLLYNASSACVYSLPLLWVCCVNMVMATVAASEAL